MSDFTGDSVTLSWQPPESNGGTPVTHYLIEKFYKVAEIKVKNQTWVIPKLYEDQPYLFRVSAINAEGQGPYLQTGTETKPHKPAGNNVYILFRVPTSSAAHFNICC